MFVSNKFIGNIYHLWGDRVIVTGNIAYFKILWYKALKVQKQIQMKSLEEEA